MSSHHPIHDQVDNAHPRQMAFYLFFSQYDRDFHRFLVELAAYRPLRLFFFH
jgi:hypothetical protein